MKFLKPSKWISRINRGGFTLEELVFSMSIASFSIAGIITGYSSSSYRAQFSAYSMAAESLAVQRVEQTRSAKWDLLAYPALDEVVSTNFPAMDRTLDVPVQGTNPATATLSTTITLLPGNPPVKMIQVDCVWRLNNRGPFTNSILTLRSPDQ